MSIFNKIITSLIQKGDKSTRQNTTHAKTIADYNRESLVNAGKKQFKKLKDLGLNIPVNLT